MPKGVSLRIIGEDKKKKKTKWSPLNAEEKKNLWRSLDFKLLFQGTPLTSETEIWENTVSSWLELMSFLENDGKQGCRITNDNFTEHVKDVIMQMRVLKAKPITPYMHVLYAHVRGMLTKYGTIKQFNTSAQELKNYTQTMQQFRGTNQKNTPVALISHQLLSIWFSDLPSTTTQLKRQNFPKVSTSSLLPSLTTETVSIPELPDSNAQKAHSV